MNSLKKYLIVLLLIASPVSQVFAQDSNSSSGSDTNNPLSGSITNPFRGGDNLFEFISYIIENVLLPIGGILAIIAFIWSGFLFVTAQGDKGKIETARRALLYTVIGTAILLGAVVLANVISGTINSLRP